MNKSQKRIITSPYTLSRNFLYNIFLQIWLLLLSILTAPYIVHKLGEEAYGIWGMVLVTLGYFQFLNLGTNHAVIKFVSEYWSKDKKEEVNRIIGVALTIHFLIGAVGCGVILLFAKFFLSLFKIPSYLLKTSYFVFYIASVSFFFGMCQSVFHSVFSAFQRFDLTTKITAGLTSIQILLFVILLYMGFHLKEVAIAYLCVQVLGLFVNLIVFKRFFNFLSLKFLFEKDIFVKLIKFGGFVLVGKIFERTSAYIDKFIIGLFMPVSWVSYYIVPYNLAKRGGAITDAIISVIFPAISELDGIKEVKKRNMLFLKSIKYVSFGIIPLFFSVIFFSREILFFWMGKNFALKSAVILQLLSLSFLIRNFSRLADITARGMGYPQMNAFVQIAKTCLHVALCFLLIPKIGIKGAAISFLAQEIVLTPVFMRYVASNMLALSLKDVVRVLKDCIFIGFIPVFLMYLMKPLITSFRTLALIFILSLIVSYIAGYFLIFDRQERRLFTGMLLSRFSK